MLVDDGHGLAYGAFALIDDEPDLARRWVDAALSGQALVTAMSTAFGW